MSVVSYGELTDDGRLEVDEDRPWNVLAARSLGEEGAGVDLIKSFPLVVYGQDLIRDK
jgi:hypothetical protein